ncbi:MAG TPA: hypothetical protein VJ756_12915 [Terriglobales bacterium]|nr:hypothetical protein [Terriglobales bacterium]
MPKSSTQRQPASEIDEAQVNRDSRRRLLLVMVGFALAAFLLNELMHSLLTPDLGPYRVRLMAEGGSALILGILAAKLLHNAYKARQYALARLQVIAELNHHVRNALEVICLSAYITHDEEAIRRIMQGVNRIEWALREILPRESFPGDPGEPRPIASALSENHATTVPGAKESQSNSNPPLEQMSHSTAPGAAARSTL